VLDVAGGKGELAFELVNVSNVPATVVDPRPLLLDNFIKRLQVPLTRSSSHKWQQQQQHQTIWGFI
jgi:ubiquinone/menaquinone biosynthesis C-methylase UbiE